VFAEDLKRTEKMTVDDVFEQSAQKMREQGMSEIAISQFRHAYHVWASEKESAWIREDTVEPLHGVRSFHDVYKTIDHDKAVHAFAKTTFLKLNGGLGTSMGLQCAKSLLPVRRHKAPQKRVPPTHPVAGPPPQGLGRCASSTSSSVRCSPRARG